MIPESAEVHREGWLRGDWWALRAKLPSSAWLKSKLPTDRQERILLIYASFVLASAVLSILKTKLQQAPRAVPIYRAMEKSK